jgi:hypothetical protein
MVEAERMKTVEVTDQFDYYLFRRRFVRFTPGIYLSVIEAAANAIVAAGCGRIVQQEEPTEQAMDARDAFKLRRL